jgi:uncharacterized membrane protein
MELLIAGLASFIAIHVVPTLGGVREALVARLGEQTWKIVHSLVSVGAIVLIVLGWRQSPFVVVYEPPAWGRHLTMLLMFVALYLLVGRRMGSNLKRWTAHPMLWGVVLWAAAHLLANGDLRSLTLFSTLAAYSLFAMWWQDVRGKARKATEVWPIKSEFYAFCATLGVYVLIVAGHRWIAGVALVG